MLHLSITWKILIREMPGHLPKVGLGQIADDITNEPRENRSFHGKIFPKKKLIKADY